MRDSTVPRYNYVALMACRFEVSYINRYSLPIKLYDRSLPRIIQMMYYNCSRSQKYHILINQLTN